MSEERPDDYLSIKIPVLHRSAPYVYVKMNTNNNSYRLSGNYKYLNEHYSLKINFIRDLDNKIDNKINKLFTIKDGVITILEPKLWQSWQIDEGGDNTLTISRIIIDNNSTSTIIVLHREYKDDINYSLFFSSNEFFNINQFFEKTGDVYA